MNYYAVSLSVLLENYNEDVIQEVLNAFSSRNKEVEHFLRSKAIGFRMLEIRHQENGCMRPYITENEQNLYVKKLSEV